MPKFIPWPHNPAIIAKVEEYENGEVVRSYWKVTLNGEERHAVSYESAVREAEDLKFWNGYCAEAGIRFDAGVPSIAEELAA